jgi:hypothetical protein
MVFDVDLKIKETTTGIGADVNIRLEVERAESGFYIASCPTQSPLIAAGETPRHAILEYLGNLFYSKTVEAEEARQ